MYNTNCPGRLSKESVKSISSSFKHWTEVNKFVAFQEKSLSGVGICSKLDCVYTN